MEKILIALQIVSSTILIVNGIWTLYVRVSEVLGHNQK